MIQRCVFLFACFALSVQANRIPQRPVEEQTWEFLLLAQFWPATSCAFFDEPKCVPHDVTGWTIHGLWPSRNATVQPENCNDTMKFNESEIESLYSDLKVQWPYYNHSHDAKGSDLWKHEWEKHGTCAYSLESLRGELRYFGKTLSLHKPLNTLDALRKANIVPSSTKRYKPQDIFAAVRQHYGTIPNIGCFYDERNHEHYFDQVWLCYTKEFQPQDCGRANYSKKRLNRPGRDTPLQFESERTTTFSKAEAHKDPNYYVDCDLKKELNYLPLPYINSAKEARVVEIVEESYEFYRLP